MSGVDEGKARDARGAPTVPGAWGQPIPTPTLEQERIPGVETGPSREEYLSRQLAGWWRGQAEKEIERTVLKAVEYGAADLEVMGLAMLHLVPREKRSRQLGLEMALAFYALGKVARLFGAFERGELPGSDTWFDLGVYCRMAERVREFGEWLPKEK